MKVMFMHAHYDDYEFTAAGMFELLQRKHGQGIQRRVVVCTDGRAGHQTMSPVEVAERRLEEQRQAAVVGGFDFEQLRFPDGSSIREACLLPSKELMASLWRSIRAFEPDYLFCPPLPSDEHVGVHNDHWTIAECIRRIAYLINVPHAFWDEFPHESEETPKSVKVPVIITVSDDYMGCVEDFDLAVDVGSVFRLIAKMSYCHESQVKEWLPWVGRHSIAAPASLDEWEGILRSKILERQKSMGVSHSEPIEFFKLTRWGEAPCPRQIRQDFPALLEDFSRL